jgi:arylsulfatase A-like enzyme
MTNIFVLLFLFGCSNQPDVVFITIDTLRVDHVSVYAKDSPSHTPALDSLAKDGVLFTQAYSPISVTGPAFVSLMTGMDISSHQVTMNVFRGGVSLSAQEVTLAKRFTEKGYRTGAFVSGFTLRPNLGLSQGFEVYDYPHQNQSRRWGDITAKNALNWFHQEDKKSFLWYHSYDAHGPWTKWGETCSKQVETVQDAEILEKIPKYQRIESCIDEQEYRKRYAKSVQFADQNVGLIIQSLKEQGRYDDALIVVTADHGESFTERELWFDHGTTAHEEQLHIPLIIKYPKNRQAGTQDNRLVSLMDVAPTVVSEVNLGKLEKSSGHKLQDKSYTGSSLLFGESSHCKRHSSLSCSPIGPKGKVFALRTQEMTLIKNGDALEQYNRSKDRYELNPLPLQSPMKNQLLQFSLERQEQVKDVVWPPKNSKSNEAEQLRKLGYVDD